MEELLSFRNRTGKDNGNQLLLQFSQESIKTDDEIYYLIDESSMIPDREDKTATQAMFGRSYQSGKTKNELISELQNCSGAQFDPEMVDILVDILEKEPESINVSYDQDDDRQIVFQHLACKDIRIQEQGSAQDVSRRQLLHGCDRGSHCDPGLQNDNGLCISEISRKQCRRRY
jgi:hypothetical protein